MIDPSLLAEVATETAEVPRDEQLKSIAFLARKQQRIENEIRVKEEALKDLKGQLGKVSELDLPDALAAVGMREFTLEDGYKVTVADEYYANIPSADSESVELRDRREACFTWLRDSGNEALIKHEIKISTGKGDEIIADSAKLALARLNIPFTDVEAVHWQTLRAFTKEQIEAGNTEFPQATFGAFVKKVATIKAPKVKKTTV